MFRYRFQHYLNNIHFYRHKRMYTSTIRSVFRITVKTEVLTKLYWGTLNGQTQMPLINTDDYILGYEFDTSNLSFKFINIKSIFTQLIIWFCTLYWLWRWSLFTHFWTTDVNKVCDHWYFSIAAQRNMVRCQHMKTSLVTVSLR